MFAGLSLAGGGQTLIGTRIRSRRKETGLSLRELGRRTSLTAGFLSQLENGRVMPSLSSLQRISTALEVPMFFFLEKTGALPDPVVRAGKRRHLYFSEPHMGYDLLTPDLNHQMMSVLIHMEPGACRVAAPLSKPTEQWMMVLDGKMRIVVKDQTYELNRGDSIYYDGESLNEFSSVGDEPLDVICCLIPPAL